MPLSGEPDLTTAQLVERFSGEFDLQRLSDPELLLIARNSLYGVTLAPLEDETRRRHHRDPHDQARRMLFMKMQDMAAIISADPTIRETKDKLDEDFIAIMANTFGQGSQKRK